MRRRLLDACRWHAATAGLFRRKANPPSSTSSSQASHRLRRVFLFYYKTHRALILLLLASNRDPLCWARGWGSRPTGGFLRSGSFLLPSSLISSGSAFRISGYQYGVASRLYRTYVLIRRHNILPLSGSVKFVFPVFTKKKAVNCPDNGTFKGKSTKKQRAIFEIALVKQK